MIFFSFLLLSVQAKRFFSALPVTKFCCLQTSDSWAVTDSTSFPPQVPRASKSAHLLDESMVWRRIPDRVDLPTAARAAHGFSPTRLQGPEVWYFEVKRNPAQDFVASGAREKGSPQKIICLLLPTM